jgi:hypothetical protein
VVFLKLATVFSAQGKPWAFNSAVIPGLPFAEAVLADAGAAGGLSDGEALVGHPADGPELELAGVGPVRAIGVPLTRSLHP